MPLLLIMIIEIETIEYKIPSSHSSKAEGVKLSTT
jgi:hypothetical protein